MRNPLRKHRVKSAVELAEAQGADKHIFVRIDDSSTEKDRHSKRFEAVDWLYDCQRCSPGQSVYSTGGSSDGHHVSIGHFQQGHGACARILKDDPPPICRDFPVAIHDGEG